MFSLWIIKKFLKMIDYLPSISGFVDKKSLMFLFESAKIAELTPPFYKTKLDSMRRTLLFVGKSGLF